MTKIVAQTKTSLYQLMATNGYIRTGSAFEALDQAERACQAENSYAKAHKYKQRWEVVLVETSRTVTKVEGAKNE